MNCPHCGADRIKHANGWLHCNACGCCFDGNHLRAGHPPCRESGDPPIAENVTLAKPPINPLVSDVPAEKVKGGRRRTVASVAPEDSANPERGE